jgi:serine protease Do
MRPIEQRPRRVATLALAVLWALSCDGRRTAAVAAVAPPAPPPPQAAAPGGVTPKTQPPEVAKLLSQAFATAAKAVRPSVVRIDVEHEAPHVARRGGRGDDASPFFGPLPPMFRRFFEFGGDGPDFPELPSPAPIAGTGSGFVLDAAGDILTNSHVVEGGAKFKVTLHDGQVIDAKVIGKDHRTDVAIIRLEKAPKNLAVARLGDSNKLEVGQWVLAIGSPLGLEQTVTAGIVSGKGHVGRNVQMSGDRVREYIQTDAKINPGNSGGPLVNLDGEVVGINTLIRVGAGGAYGFAVPINEAYRVAQLLLRDGRVRYPFLGVNVADIDRLDPKVKDKLGKGAPSKGAYVAEVTPGSPAAKAGIDAGDVITKIGDRQINLASDVVDQVSSHKIGDTVIVTLVRAGDTKVVRATLAESPSEETQAEAAPRLGLSLQSLTPSLAQSLGLPSGTRGAAIADVAPGSPAERAGLQAGEVIVEVDRKKIESADEAISALRGGGNHLLRVRGNAGTRFVTLGGG